MAVALGKPSGGRGPSLSKRGGGGGFGVTFIGLDEAIAKLNAGREMVEQMGRFEATIESDSPIADIIVGGSRPHMIYPRSKRALAWPGGRHPVAWVRHPGTAPNPFMQDTLDEMLPELEARTATEMDRGFDEANPRAGLQALQLGANRIVGRARQRAPRRTGAFAASIRASWRVF